MFNPIETQRITAKSIIDDYLLTWVEAFLIDRKARGLSEGTILFYKVKLKLFCKYCKTQLVKQISQITPSFLREFLLYLEETGHNEGGRHAAYRTIRAFLYWYEDEVEPEGWKNPIRKVRAPKVPTEPIDPVPIDVVSKMLKTCPRNTFTGERDTAIMLCLLDTGVRASELLAIDFDDINQARGDILIRQGKGRKPRTVYFGKQSKRAIRRYLSHRNDNSPALWITHPRFGSARLTYYGLRSIIARRAIDAGVSKPTLHDFRRTFALSMLRNGTDIFTLAKLTGHSNITILQRYLKQTSNDLRLSHKRSGPVDHYLLRNPE